MLREPLNDEPEDLEMSPPDECRVAEEEARSLEVLPKDDEPKLKLPPIPAPLPPLYERADDDMVRDDDILTELTLVPPILELLSGMAEYDMPTPERTPCDLCMPPTVA